MAKRSLFWGQASGKLGETVLYRAGGEQRTRAYVAKIKNPKTLAQMENRLSMLNFATIYRNLKPILSVSFPNRTTAQSGFNAFVKANKSVNSPVIGKEDAQKGLSAPINVVMSEGFLSNYGQMGRVKVEDDTVVGLDVTNSPNGADLGKYIAAGWVTGSDTSLFIQGLGLSAKAKITFIVATYVDTGYKLTSKTIELADFEDETAIAGLNVGVLKTEDNKLFIGVKMTANDAQDNLVCVILSDVDENGKVQVTTSRMIGATDENATTAQFFRNGQIWENVLNHYGYSEGNVLG